MREPLSKLAALGGQGDVLAYHDCPPDLVIYENSGACITVGDVRDARQALLVPDTEAEQAYGYLSRLFAEVAPQCKPLDTLMGLCTQIDNYIAGLRLNK